MDKNKIIGLKMSPAETLAFFRSFRKRVLTFFGYSADYENQDAMLAIVRKGLSKIPPDASFNQYRCNRQWDRCCLSAGEGNGIYDDRDCFECGG